MKKTNKILLFIISLLLTLSISGCQKQTTANPDMQAKFDQFIEQEFIDTMESDYTTLHCFIENPEDFNIDMNNVEISFGSGYDQEALAQAKEITEKTAAKFNQFDRDALTTSQQETYDIYQSSLNLALKLNDDKYDYLAPVFETATGDYCQIPTLLTDWTLRNEQDVQDLITLVDDTDRYFQSQLDYVNKQAENQTLSINVDEVINYCNSIIDNQDSSSILESLNNKIDALDIDSASKDSYKQQLETVYQESFITAYQNIIDTLEQLDSNQINQGGLSNLEYGKEYYQLLLQNATGSDKTVTEIQSKIEDAMNDCLTQMQKILVSNPSSQIAAQNNFSTIKTNYTSYEDIIDDLASEIKNDFPDIGTINYQVAAIDPALANDSIAAYYNLPALDSTIPNQIRVNTNNNEIDIQDVNTFQTIAHEGIPGHMYQTNYSYQNLDNNYRIILASNSAFQEGWAVYVQYYCNKYLSQQINSDILELMKYNNIYSYYAMILADIGIHYEGWDLDEFNDNLTELGFALSDQDGLKQQYNQLRDNPTIFVPYYYGYLEFSNLKEKAQAALKDNFNDQEFHQALLESGSVPFSIVEQHVDQYIEANQ